MSISVIKKIVFFLFVTTSTGFLTCGSLSAQNSFKSIGRDIDRGFDIFISERDSEILKKTDTNGETLLMLAVKRGKAQYIDKLIKNGVDLFARDRKGQNALVFAIQSTLYPSNEAQIEVIKKLVDRGLNINVGNMCLESTKECIKGKTPIMYAAEAAHNKIMNELISMGGNPGLTDADGFTSTMYAVVGSSTLKWISNLNKIKEVRNNYIDIIETLSKKGVPIDAQTKSDQTTALMLAASYGVDELIIDKLINLGADINKQDREGKTALMYSTEAGNIDTLKILLSKNADPSISDKIEHEIQYMEPNLIDKFGDFFTTKILKKEKKERPEYINWTAREYAAKAYIIAADRYFIGDAKNEVVAAKTEMKLYKNIISEIDKALKKTKKHKKN